MLGDPLAALLTHLDRLAQAMDVEPSKPTVRADDIRQLVRVATESAERLRALVTHPQRAPVASHVAAGEPLAAPSHQARVLVVDDDPTIGNALARALRGYEVVVVESARAALDRVVAGDRFELVLCDLMMPDMSGMDLYEEVVRLVPEQARRFVFVTGGAVTTRARDFVRTVPNLVLTKPFDLRKIRELVRDRGQRSDRVVLVVDDDEVARMLIVRWLTGAKFTCIEHASGGAAIQALLAHPDAVDAVVLDVMMPELDGFDVLAALKADPGTAHIPVVMLTAHAVGEAEVARGIDAGASYYLTKPFQGPVLVAQVRAACERSDAERELRTRLQFAEQHATTDALTGLMNRRAFEGRLAEGMANASRHREPFALVMLDLDHFKQINDTFGHEGGDRMLLYFARALRRAIRVGDQAFRYGGEEFALLLPKCDAQGAMRVVSRVQLDLRARPVSVVEGSPVVVRFSAGIAAAEAANGFRVEELVSRADAALYRAKNSGRDCIELGE